MTGLFQGLKGARRWRQILSTETHKPDVTPDILLEALSQITQNSIHQSIT